MTTCDKSSVTAVQTRKCNASEKIIQGGSGDVLDFEKLKNGQKVLAQQCAECRVAFDLGCLVPGDLGNTPVASFILVRRSYSGNSHLNFHLACVRCWNSLRFFCCCRSCCQ